MNYDLSPSFLIFAASKINICMPNKKITELLADKAEYLLNHQSKTVAKDQLHLPGADFLDRVWMSSDRNVQVLRNLQSMYGNGRLARTGYLSILPVDQGIEHSGELHLQRTLFISTRRTL